ncbi:MAG TPA: 4Fe-4S dicluster domain-containing protein [Polyangia bacterium]|jgi:Na+-translocating ferredoxin:NAD+ oxidoreductase RnfC subunit
MSSPIVDRVRAAGIVGAGGAGFPTHVKLGATADTVIANGAECEPLLRCDKAVLKERTADVLLGLGALAEAVGARRLVLALKGHYADLVAHVRRVAAELAPVVAIVPLDNYYPAGDEQVLVHEVTGRVVPEGGIPLNVGVVVDNVITLMQVAEAVRDGRPVTRRPLTVAGAVPRALTLAPPLGAPMRLAVELCGGATVPDWVLLEGGPMMGRLVTDPDEPITKRTSGLIVLPREHALVQRRQATLEREVRLARVVCCQCRMCTDLCPRRNLGHALQPHLAMRALKHEGVVEAPPEHVTAAFLCCLCGACETYACPLGLSPRRVYGSLRAELAKAGHKNPHTRKDLVPDELQQLRRIPLPRLIARLGLTEYVDAPHAVDLRPIAAPRVRLRLGEHTGAPARPVVAVGQAVRAGDLVAEIPEGKLGARYHASIDGTVVAVDPTEVQIARS